MKFDKIDIEEKIRQLLHVVEGQEKKLLSRLETIEELHTQLQELLSLCEQDEHEIKNLVIMAKDLCL